MTTLTATPLAPLLDRLFEEAAAVPPIAIPAVAELSRPAHRRARVGARSEDVSRLRRTR